jgi:competence ComEA-like helix-hairpin-helix protein
MKQIILMCLVAYGAPIDAFQKVDINEASSEQIALLPGIGDNLAKELVSYRKKNQGLNNSEELSKVQGMTQKKLQMILPYVVFKSSPIKKTPAAKPIELISIEKKPMMPFAQLEKASFKALSLTEDMEQDLSLRARRSAWLPRLGFAFDIDRDTAQKNTRKKPDALEKRGTLDMGFAIRATFDLPELIFNKAEIEVVNIAQKRMEKREKISEKLQSLYFRYVNLNNSFEEPKEIEEIKSIEAALSELAISLDSLSNGAFSRYQKQAQGTL